MSDRISIIFCGTSTFAVPSLEALAKDERFSIQRVITQPDRPVGRKQELTPPPVKIAAENLGLEILQTENINDEPETRNQKPNPDFLVVVSFGQLLKQPLLDFPLRMPVNVHASLLPRWRGASPLQHAILSGDKEAGVTVQRIVKQLDAGPILSQERTSIGPRETYQALHDRLAATGAELLMRTLKDSIVETEQDEREITVCKKLSRTDGHVTVNDHTALDIDRRVRALNPWPGVTMEVDGQTLKLLETALEPMGDHYPVTCSGGTTLFLVKVLPPGGKPMSGMDWARGRRGK